MRLPFTSEEFFDVFAQYNGTLWPAIVALWLASFLICARLLLAPAPRDRWVSGLLAFHWAWAALAYHVAFFARINPAAWLFAAMFLVQAGLFFWLGVIRSKLSYARRRTAWTTFGWILVAYALVYPAVNAVEHGTVMRIATFGVPCPTTILTGGLLLLASPRLRALAVVPVIWSAIGGSAAGLLGVTADYALPVTGAALVLFELQKPAGSASVRPASPLAV